MNEKQYVTYHLHSDLSLLDSCTKFQDYVGRAVELGQKAICFTEHGNVYKWIEKKEVCEKAGLKYLHGCEVYLTAQLEPKVRDNYHTILIAKNEKGLREINSLVSTSNTESHFYFKPRITFEEFMNISDNVIKISACLASPLARLEKERDKLKEDIKYQKINISSLKLHYKDNLKDDKYINSKQEIDDAIEILQKQLDSIEHYYNEIPLKYDYYEIQPHINSEEQKEYNKRLVELSKKNNKPLIAGTDTHSLNQYKAECRSIMQLAKGIEFSNEDQFDLTYKSYDELVDMFKQQGVLDEDIYLDAINNTNIMADSVEEIVLDKSFKYPKVYDDDISEIKSRINIMFKEKLDKGIISKEQQAQFVSELREELKVFEKINMCGFMLFMSDLIVWCHKNNIPTGFARGSCGGSCVAYVLDIIDVNPLQWKTVFSRFANEDRKEIGD